MDAECRQIELGTAVVRDRKEHADAEHVVWIGRRDSDVREIKRPLIRQRVLARERPMRPRVVGTPQDAVARFYQRVHAAWKRRRKRHPDATDRRRRKTVSGDLMPRSSTVGRSKE